MKKLSYADIAKKLASKEKKYTSLLNKANNKVEANTAQRMLDRINQRKQSLASENQMRADQINNKSFAYGGSTKKKVYRIGGATDKKIYAPGGATNNVPPLNPNDPYSVWWYENFGNLPAEKQPPYGLKPSSQNWTAPDGSRRYSGYAIIDGKYVPAFGNNYPSENETTAYNSIVGKKRGRDNSIDNYNVWYNEKYGHLPGFKRALYDPSNRKSNDEFKTWERERYNTLYVNSSESKGLQPMIGENHVLPSEVKGEKSLFLSNYNPLTGTMGTLSESVLNDVAGMNFPPQIPQGDVEPPILSPEATAELGLTEPTVKKGSGTAKSSSSAKKGYDNSNVMGFLNDHKDYLNYLREQGLRPTAENIKKLQEFIGTKVDNLGGKNTMAALQSNYDQWYKQAKAQGATDQEADKVAQSKVEDLKEIPFNPLDNKANFDPSFQDKTMSAIGMAGNFIDNAARFRQIRNTQRPIAPTFAEAPMLETRYNISPQLNEMRSAQAAYNRGVDQSALSGGQAMNAKAAAYSARINAANRLYGEKNNREQALRNRQRQLSADVKNRNNQMYSAYRNQLVDFENARQGAIAQNTANFGQDMSSIGSDYMKNVRAPKMQLEAWKPYLNRVGVMDRNYNIYGNQNS